MCASLRRVSSDSTSCASASCGTARGLTNDVASMWRTPAAIIASMISALTAVSMNRSSDWKPSRVPTSVTRTLRSFARCGVA